MSRYDLNGSQRTCNASSLSSRREQHCCELRPKMSKVHTDLRMACGNRRRNRNGIVLPRAGIVHVMPLPLRECEIRVCGFFAWCRTEETERERINRDRNRDRDEERDRANRIGRNNQNCSKIDRFAFDRIIYQSNRSDQFGYSSMVFHCIDCMSEGGEWTEEWKNRLNR